MKKMFIIAILAVVTVAGGLTFAREKGPNRSEHLSTYGSALACSPYGPGCL